VEPFLTSIVTALVAGASAKAKDIASEVVASAYAGLKDAVVHKLGKAGAVQSVEDDPGSESARAALVEAVAKGGFARDQQLERLSERVTEALAESKSYNQEGQGQIQIDSIRGAVNVVVENLVASGRIDLGPIIGEAGSVRVSGLTAGTDISANVPRRANADDAMPRKN
jgi:hypothetical protein